MSDPGKKDSSGAGAGAGTMTERKAAIRATLESLAAAADASGLASTARDIREVRIPKLDEERFSLVVLGEFNHGKSTFINALLGEAVLPTGITPTTAVLTHIVEGSPGPATLVFDSGERRQIAAGTLAPWVTVEGEEASAAAGTNGSPTARGRTSADAPAGNGSPATTAEARAGLHHVEVTHPAPILANHLTIVDTPGVNDINEQRAEITYGYVPRADAAIFLLDATQILTASERQFLEERILRSARDRLIFVIAKADLLDQAELAETVQFARRHLGQIVAEPAIFTVSARRALAGDREGSGMAALVQHLRTTVDHERRQLLLDHALADATRLSSFVRQSLGMRRRSLELPLPELEERIARAKDRLQHGKKALGMAADTIAAETAALKARVRQDLADFAAEFREALPPEIEKVDAADIRRYLSFFVQDTWKAWAEAEGERIAEELERLAEKVIQVANENVREVAHDVSAELGPAETRIEITVDTLKYDVSVFALGALGTTIFLFVNGVVGGLLTVAAPVLAFILRGRVGQEIKQEAKQQAPLAIDRVAALLGPKLDEFVDTFAGRLSDFVAEAGEALARGIAEVLDRALRERRTHDVAVEAHPETVAIEAGVRELRAIDERIADIRQRLWTVDAPETAPAAPAAPA
jgi:GTPase Era involved in 16S rRNA processing